VLPHLNLTQIMTIDDIMARLQCNCTRTAVNSFEIVASTTDFSFTKKRKKKFCFLEKVLIVGRPSL
jgi:hypothetical protein